MRIVVDVMGGDHGCEVVIEGVKAALQASNKISGLYLVGDEEQIRAAMDQTRLRDDRIRIVHAAEVLTMEDKPLDVLRRKKDCSMARAMELVKEGQGDAMISRGNTGGLMAAATVRLRPHQRRPRANRLTGRALIGLPSRNRPRSSASSRGVP